jgi:hypothetical protein
MQHFACTAYRFGPIPLTLVMVPASLAYYPWRHYDSWMAYAILLGALATFLWHLALIVTERQKIFYLVYTLLNMPLYVYVGFYCLFLVTGDSL